MERMLGALSPVSALDFFQGFLCEAAHVGSEGSKLQILTLHLIFKLTQQVSTELSTHLGTRVTAVS